ncbi:MAG: phosphate propanoyltransferase [Bacillales bacterium]|jgi:putative phosphotransacetylase|nr:phosphate propanoyltransferase [Bacillales bacterium]
MKFIIETSARHVHVDQNTLEALFGKGYTLHPKKDLSQPGQYASEEKVTVVGPKKEIAGVSILGPVRNETQVELSATDARTIGVLPVIRESGDIIDTPSVILRGPMGEVSLKEGVIVAKRHIHMTPKDAKEFNVKDKDIVQVRAFSNGRSLIFDDVVIRVKDSFSLAMHIDTDEANAAFGVCEGEIVR